MLVKITNKYWNSIHLQVRVGNKEPAEQNPLVFDSQLGRDQERDFQFDNLLFYRRDANPDAPDGRFTDWVECFTDLDVDNP